MGGGRWFSFFVGTAVGAWAMNGYIRHRAVNGNTPWIDTRNWHSHCQEFCNFEDTIDKVRQTMN